MKKITLLAFAVAAAGAAYAGPIGKWMLTDGDHATDAFIQGSNVQTFGQAAGTTLQYPLCWNANYLGGTFTTIGRDVLAAGGVYDQNHVQVDTFLNFSNIDGQHLDGTLDTKRSISYATNYSTGDIVQYADQYFNSPVGSIYNAGAGDVWSITYNGKTDTLFLGRNGVIDEITVGGAFVGSFAAAGGRIRSLAYDASDSTMWYLTDDGQDIVQIDEAGNILSREVVGLGGNYWGGEIAPVPEPATMAALGLGAAALLRRRRK